MVSITEKNLAALLAEWNDKLIKFQVYFHFHCFREAEKAITIQVPYHNSTNSGIIWLLADDDDDASKKTVGRHFEMIVHISAKMSPFPKRSGSGSINLRAIYNFDLPRWRGLHSGSVSACHRRDWSYGSWDRIPPGYRVVVFKEKKCIISVCATS
jgi:hypothetical protein